MAHNLSITISYLTSGELSRIGPRLRANPSDDQPGWFVRATTEDGYIPYTRIPAETAMAAADALDSTRLCNAVARVHHDHLRTAKQRREAAEAMIEKGKRILDTLDREATS